MTLVPLREGMAAINSVALSLLVEAAACYIALRP
jgi:hypothetical protein